VKRNWDFKWWMYPTTSMAAVVMTLSVFYGSAIPTLRVGCFVGLVLICFILGQASGAKSWRWPWSNHVEDERCS
jgi:hypothetical protein